MAADDVFPAESVNLPDATSIVAAPSADGVKVAVYEVLLAAVNELNVPFDKV